MILNSNFNLKCYTKFAFDMKNLNMNKIHFFLASVLLWFTVSCGSQSSEKKSSDTTPTEEKCTYSLKTDELRVAWKAYKFTEKVGVNGRFDSISTKLTNESADSPDKLLEGLTLIIKTNGLNSDNEDRDNKIKTQFFGNIKGEEMVGSIKKITDEKIVIALTINEIEKEVSLDYEITDTEITANGQINVNDWEGQAGITALNKVCEELHQGTDGKSVLHPDVKMSVSVPILKNCN